MSSQASLAHCGAQESMKKQVNLPKRGEGKKKKKKPGLQPPCMWAVGAKEKEAEE